MDILKDIKPTREEQLKLSVGGANKETFYDLLKDKVFELLKNNLNSNIN